MSAITGSRLHCDFRLLTGELCPETIEVMPSTTTEARAVAREEGWSYQRRQDRCPKHTAWYRS